MGNDTAKRHKIIQRRIQNEKHYATEGESIAASCLLIFGILSLVAQPIIFLAMLDGFGIAPSLVTFLLCIIARNVIVSRATSRANAQLIANAHRPLSED